jgi:hypothetical protein
MNSVRSWTVASRSNDHCLGRIPGRKFMLSIALGRVETGVWLAWRIAREDTEKIPDLPESGLTWLKAISQIKETTSTRLVTRIIAGALEMGQTAYCTRANPSESFRPPLPRSESVSKEQETMIRPHAFVAMPFGIKPGADGKPIDFNLVYREYIAPALEAAGLVSFRADKEILPEGQSRRGLATTARDHGQTEAHGQRGEDTNLQGAGRGVSAFARTLLRPASPPLIARLAG